ncbi:putative membrane protein [Escherichia coli]|nr:putative membrane protein [Escherichia coli]
MIINNIISGVWKGYISVMLFVVNILLPDIQDVHDHYC